MPVTEIVNNRIVVVDVDLDFNVDMDQPFRDRH
jgi:hypothetical protein